MKTPGDKRPATEDISITAQVRTKEVSFKRKPNTETRFCGSQELDTASGTERANIPYEVQPGVEYRDVEVRLLISGELNADSGDVNSRNTGS